ncbi:MAG: type II toxin-antitoxin system death-on-curing family toxin [bacterium]|nr:type II toxin-antitoxin system death-on-curing family toxin [bacterium]
MRAKPITVVEVEHIAFALAQRVMTWDEPFPAFQTRTPHALERCLAAPFAGHKGGQFYHGIAEKAAILFYLLIKNHPFLNGNKRIAVTSLFVFLSTNGKWVNADPKHLYAFAKWVAESDPKHKDQTVAAIEKYIKEHMVQQ